MPKPLAAAAIAAALLAAGCAQYQTPQGPVWGTLPPLTWTFPVGPQPIPPAPPPGQMPPDFGSPLAEAGPAPDLTGTYTGSAIVTLGRGYAKDCHDERVTAFKVSGTTASLFEFRGTIVPGGAVVMQGGDRWISGRFIGRSFQGQLWQRFPACTWNLTLTARP